MRRTPSIFPVGDVRKRSVRWRTYWRRALATTRGTAEARWQALVKPAAAAATATALVVLGWVEGKWWEALGLSLAAGLLTLAVAYALDLGRNFYRSPKVTRAHLQVPAGMFGRAAIGFGSVADADIMQLEASLIACAVREYLERSASKDRPIQPHERKRLEDRIEDSIAQFGRRAREDVWLSWSSRRRSLRLYAARFSCPERPRFHPGSLPRVSGARAGAH